MNKTRKPRSVRATEEGRQKLEQSKAAKRDDKKPWTYEDIATAAKVDEKTVQKFFKGVGVDKDSAYAIVEALDLPITKVVNPNELNPPPAPEPTPVDWREECGPRLAEATIWLSAVGKYTYRGTGDQPNQYPIFKAELEENIPVALYVDDQKGVVPQVEDGFRYDAYISYVDKDPDTTWVWDTLLPRLEKAGLRVAVSGDSENPGVARVVNIERGITQAKRTIVVLSEAYLANNMVDFENVLGQTMGIQEGEYRLLPVKSAPIDQSQLPVRLSMLTTLDLTHPRHAEREFNRLVQALQGPLPRR